LPWTPTMLETFTIEPARFFIIPRVAARDV
jgi:hypothetical protein